ncbi:MAG: DUF454 family protein [Candidatus Kapaibacteriota bacterium]
MFEKFRKVLFLALGLLSLVMAILGIFLPLLPTTPFLLLSAYLFAKSSTKLYNWLLRTKYFGKIIKDYKAQKGVAPGIKVFALIFLWTTILATILFFFSPWYLDLILILIASLVSYHILKLKTLK